MPPGAERKFQAALAVAPSHTVARRHYGALLANQERNAEAIHQLKLLASSPIALPDSDPLRGDDSLEPQDTSVFEALGQLPESLTTLSETCSLRHPADLRN